jgi:hypothetical protein
MNMPIAVQHPSSTASAEAEDMKEEQKVSRASAPDAVRTASRLRLRDAT